MSKVFNIPRRGNAGVAFVGVEMKDSWLFFGGLFGGLIGGSLLDWGTSGFVGIPLAGYYLNKAYIDWRSNNLPGSVLASLFSRGWYGYSPTLKSQKTVFVGDGVVINPASKKHIQEIQAKQGAADGT